MRVILEDRRGIPCIDYAGGLRFQTKMIHDQDNIPWHRAWSVLVLAHSGIPSAVVSYVDSSFNDGLDNGLTKVCRYPQSFPTLRKHSQGKYRPNGVAAGPEKEARAIPRRGKSFHLVGDTHQVEFRSMFPPCYDGACLWSHHGLSCGQNQTKWSGYFEMLGLEPMNSEAATYPSWLIPSRRSTFQAVTAKMRKSSMKL